MTVTEDILYPNRSPPTAFTSSILFTARMLGAAARRAKTRFWPEREKPKPVCRVEDS
ncbi:MAG: hypothetical protein QW379_07445 [Thermoplasmata archaeon]